MSIEQVRQKLVLAQANQAHFEGLTRHPKLSPRARLAAHNSARSYRAAVVLYQKALEYERAKAQHAAAAKPFCTKPRGVPLVMSAPPIAPK